MKNFPHQFNDLEKLFQALQAVRQLISENRPLTDDNFGVYLTRRGIYTYRNRSLSIEEYLSSEQHKPPFNRGYLTVARDIRRLFELLGFITVFPDKTAQLTPVGNELLTAQSSNRRTELWKNAFMQLSLEGIDGEISHPYRILLRLVNLFPGIETPKLMLALVAKNDSEEEFERIRELASRPITEIIRITNTSDSMAANAVKILPGVAEQLNDIRREHNRAYSIAQIIITEDEITTQEPQEPLGRIIPTTPFRRTSADDIARYPNLNAVTSISVDYSEAIRIRQRRIVEHQEIVRLIASVNQRLGFDIFEGHFDCLAVKDNCALLYEVKTITSNSADEERQTIKGVGQLKFYKYSILNNHGYTQINEFLIFSRKPSTGIIEFCRNESITVVWREGNGFKIKNRSGVEEVYDPTRFIRSGG